MDAAQTIRNAVARVTALRAQTQADLHLHSATVAVKKFQALRFAGTYDDLLGSKEYGSATRFFLEELYSDKDYSLRDAQFARIAGALQTFFPQQVVATAVSLAQLHALTEELDHQMALVWTGSSSGTEARDAASYVRAWNTVGQSEERKRQLDVVLTVGQELDRLTRTPGLRLMLKMMRRSALAAGLGSLQTFLESGFDTFAGMSGKGQRALEFLGIIRARESVWIARLFASDAVTSESALRECLGKALLISVEN
ncbi:FFLEELY motif protein [Rhodoferax saidenbachensis]|uniref:DUF8198 domain-containing protein n=2 Tax=Rhodoferax saidenbachensis TaxID=1484693 RepID=A0A1P8K6R5_9BURK|nr:hypothetical protein [Rhodoferax saidenbachensis]APW41646.1 hypothetical protein RS694_03185 [Rhodoferax saidenbachensis]